MAAEFARVLLVDDDPQALDSTRKILELAGYQVTTAIDGEAALELVRPVPGRAGPSFDLVVTDVRMPRLGGMEFLRAIALCGERIPVILMTAYGRVEDAVWAMKLGAVDFLTKPFKRQTLLSAVEAALKRARQRSADGDSAGPAAAPPAGPQVTEALLGSSARMRELRTAIEQVAPTAATVLLSGESGTGKELVALSLHRRSARAAQPFVPVNCAAIPEHLIESELFGFEKGAFTGATGAKEGLFEAADGGTLLLDEIGDMPLPLQAKLLRILQNSEVRRIGATSSRKVDVRVIAATHLDLNEAARAGRFRQDLLFRLEVVMLRVPPLRERAEDVPEFAEHFLRKAALRHGKSVKSISGDAMAILLQHAWPGNVRELSNVIERAVIFSSGEEVARADLPPHLLEALGGSACRRVVVPPQGARGMIEVPLGTSIKDVEELLIRKTLEATSGDKNMTAKLLGLNERTIYRKLSEQPK